MNNQKKDNSNGNVWTVLAIFILIIFVAIGYGCVLLSEAMGENASSIITSVTSKEEKEDTSGTTPSQKNAIKMAKLHLETMAFSRNGLIHQLEFEGFSTEDATYGVDNSGANWNEQAKKSAKHYLDYTAFSRKGLIHQLEFEKFSNEEAIYGVDNSGANWKEQAKKAAKQYLDTMPFSRKGLIQQLSSEYGSQFTYEEAVYGVEANGL